MIIKVIKTGLLIRDDYGNILDARSTVTLIKTQNKNIIVDTGSSEDKNELIKNLENEGLDPYNIDIVIITHLHCDHTGNNNLFLKAKFIAHEKEKPSEKYIQIHGNYNVLNGIKIFETPGHSFGSISVAIKSNKNYVIAGDALPIKDNYLKWVPPGINIGEKIAIKSMEKIIEIADIVIPGHDEPFFVEK